MRVLEPVEILYLTLMLRWEKTAPKDKHQGYLDSKPVRNTQTQRLKYALEKIAVGSSATTQNVYSTLARHTRRDDGESYISQNPDWMKEPTELSGGWFFEGCTSMPQKEHVIAALSYVGLSGPLIHAVVDFVAHEPISKYLPIADDEPEINRRIKAWDDKHNNVAAAE